jgi:hypothetical protein
MSAREAVLTAAHLGVWADNAEEGYAQIRSITDTEFPDAELAEAVAEIVHDGLIRDPVRLLSQQLQCFWQLVLEQDL